MRALVAVLLLLNAVFFAWTQGWLDSVAGLRAHGDREPERLAQQVRPETVRVLSASAVAALAAANAAAAGPAASAASGAASGVPATGGAGASAVSASVPVPVLACVEAGPFSAAELPAAEAALKPLLPAGRWADVAAERGGVWALLMGPYASREAQLKKEQELKRINVVFDEIAAPPRGPGLSLGRHDSRAAADAALAQLARRGIHTARVAELVAPQPGHLLRVDRADAALLARLAGLQSSALGKGFGPCAGTATAAQATPPRADKP